MVLEASYSYLTLLIITLFFSAFAFVIKSDSFWRETLKIVAAMFWWILGVAQVIFFGADGSLMAVSLAYIMFGMLFVFSIIKDILTEKHDKAWIFED